MDFRNLKKLTIGGKALKQLLINGIQVWKSFTNQVPISTDTDGSIFNGTGYKENVRLSSSGGISSSAQNGSVTTGFIPCTAYDVLRLKGVEWIDATANHGGHYYLVYYDADKKLTGEYGYISSGNHKTYAHIFTATRDESGVETLKWNTEYGKHAMLDAVKKASFVRITAYGKGADFIVTINEEIT